jgi:DNA repair exonuclease SbcCD ATPase subunit
MIPSRLKMKNFFSHKDSEIDFSMFNSALLIGNTEGNYSKSNGSGKSAVFEAILWCLFNKSRAAMMDDIIRWGEKTCSVDLEFSHNDVRYMVTRIRNRINSTSSVEFFILGKDGIWQNSSCSTSGDTNLKIEEVIKLDYKTFINSVYFRQNDISEFAECDPSKKKEILKSIVDISRWDDYEKGARKKVRDINSECKVLRGAISDYDDVTARLADTALQIGESEKNATSLKSRYQSFVDEIGSLDSKYALLKKSLDTNTYDRVIDDLKKLNLEKESLANKKLLVETSAKGYDVDKISLEKDTGELEAKLLGRSILPVEDGRIDSLRAQLIHFKVKKSSSQEVIKALDEREILVGECYTCEQPISDEVHSRLKCDHDDRRILYTEQFSEANDKILSLEGQLEASLSAEKENAEIQRITAQVDSVQYKLNLIKDSLKKELTTLGTVDDKLSQVLFKITNNMDVLESIKNDDFQSLRLKLKELKRDRDDTKDLISEQDKEAGRLAERHSVLSQRESKMQKDKKKISKKLKRASLFEKLGKMFGKGGIQTILLDFVIEDLEDTSNGILASICNEPSIIVLDTQRPGADGVSIIETLDLKVRKDGHLQNFKSLSGGEKFRISLALRVALSDISSRYGGSSLEFLLLDEVNSPLDRYGVETLFVSVIKSLEDRYKILVITHDESLKEKFDNVIDVTKVNGESELEFLKR